jgi:hypothetical protein
VLHVPASSRCRMHFDCCAASVRTWPDSEVAEPPGLALSIDLSPMSSGRMVITFLGKVIATARRSVEQSDVQTSFRPAPGQTVHEVEVPDEYATLSPQDLHEKVRTSHQPSHCH